MTPVAKKKSSSNNRSLIEDQANNQNLKTDESHITDKSENELIEQLSKSESKSLNLKTKNKSYYKFQEKDPSKLKVLSQRFANKSERRKSEVPYLQCKFDKDDMALLSENESV